jgi:hypothetical protein
LCIEGRLKQRSSILSLYELAIIGNVTQECLASLMQTIGEMISSFGLRLDADVVTRDAASLQNRDLKASIAAIYFGGDASKDLDAVDHLLRSSVPILPVASSAERFQDEIPPPLRFLNGVFLRADDPQMRELGAALLECVGLLRKQRRLFVSYRRTESRNAAMQLHDVLTSRGFDVFLDTHDVRPGEPFQDVLWNRLCDSDVLIMLDTPTYFESKWTRQELGRARAKGIHILRLVWPGHVPSRQTEFAETIYLDNEQVRETGLLEGVLNDIALAVEQLRSKSLASRHMAIAGSLRADIARIGASVVGVGPHRAISIQLEDQRRLYAYPIVGVPTAELLNDVADKARQADQNGVPILIYDYVGLSDSYISHLKWLDQNIKVVRAIRSAEANWQLAAWEG